MYISPPLQKPERPVGGQRVQKGVSSRPPSICTKCSECGAPAPWILYSFLLSKICPFNLTFSVFQSPHIVLEKARVHTIPHIYLVVIEHQISQETRHFPMWGPHSNPDYHAPWAGNPVHSHSVLTTVLGKAKQTKTQTKF